MLNDVANGPADRAIGDAASRVAPLSELYEYEVADGYPDVRSWDVRDPAGRPIGYVYDLLVDTEALRVRYLDVELDPEFAASEADRGVLIPVEHVGFDGASDGVLLRDIGAGDVRALVPHARRGVTREPETVLPHAPGLAAAAPTSRQTDAEFLRDRHYDDERLFARPHGAGAAIKDEGPPLRSDAQSDVTPPKMAAAATAVRKTLSTDRVRKSVSVMREEVQIERRPVRPGEEIREADVRGDEIRIPLMAEELVVEKHLVTKEVLIIRKRAITEQVDVEAEVRREHAEVDEPVERLHTVGRVGGPESRA